jgi:hypothetical protein
VGAGGVGGAVKVTSAVHQEVAIRPDGSKTVAGEAVKNAKSPARAGRRQLEYRAPPFGPWSLVVP